MPDPIFVREDDESNWTVVEDSEEEPEEVRKAMEQKKLTFTERLAERKLNWISISRYYLEGDTMTVRNRAPRWTCQPTVTMVVENFIAQIVEMEDGDHGCWFLPGPSSKSQPSTGIFRVVDTTGFLALYLLSFVQSFLGLTAMDKVDSINFISPNGWVEQVGLESDGCENKCIRIMQQMASTGQRYEVLAMVYKAM